MKLALALALALFATGCVRSEDPGEPTVFAATSLKPALEGHEDARYSFAGSDQLVAQVRSGSKPDVIATASAVMLRELHAEGRVEAPVEFAYNRLVVAVPRDGRVKGFADLGDRGVRIAVGTRGVPVGSYARAVLTPRMERNIASEEPNSAAVLARVRSGAVDAAIVYRTDIGDLRALAVPVPLRPAYAVAVVSGTERAREFVRWLTGRGGREALQRAGFELPPGQ